MADTVTISGLLEQITTDRNTIRTWVKNIGKAEDSAKLTALASTISKIPVYNPSGTVNPGNTYRIEPGYYTGGTVTGVEGEGQYDLQSVTVTPTKEQQSITPDEGIYGLSEVTVEAIPTEYQNVSSVTATAETVLSGSSFVNKDGGVVNGNMANVGKQTHTLDTTENNTSVAITKGYHDGSGSVSLVTETKSCTPNESTQNVIPSQGRVLKTVTVNPIPSEYVSAKTEIENAKKTGTTADQVLTGEAFINSEGKSDTGRMPNNPAETHTITTQGGSFTIPKGYHSGNGKVVAQLTASTPITGEINGIDKLTVEVPAGYYSASSTVTFNDQALIIELQKI